MPNAASDRRSTDRMLLHPHSPTPASAADESESDPRPTPLTPCNTWSTSADADELEVSTALSTSLDAGSHTPDILDNDDDTLEHVEQLEIEERDTDEDSDGASLQATQSEPLHDFSVSETGTVIRRRPAKYQRSSSVPSRPLKSALARTPPPSRTSDSQSGTKKRARFNDASASEHLVLRQNAGEAESQRRHSAPTDVERIPTWSRRSPSSTDSVSSEDREVLAALGIFEEVVDELMEMAEEHADAHDELSEVCRGVADAIFASRESNYEADDEDDSPDNDDHVDHEAESDDLSGSISQSSADEDVDESCIERSDLQPDKADHDLSNEPDAADIPEREASREVLFETERGELQSPDLESIAEEPNTSTETVKATSTTSSDQVSKRRVSEPHIQSTAAIEANDIRRRSSMTDFVRMKRRLNLPPLSKAKPAGCAVTACSVRAIEPPKLNTVYEHPGARYRPPSPVREATRTAQTVHSDSGTFQVL